jgi:hypothetical protein
LQPWCPSRIPPCDELRLQPVINYGLKFSGVVVTIIGPECVPMSGKFLLGSQP